MGIFHFSTIYDYWRSDGIAFVALIVVEKMARDRYVLLRKYIYCLNHLEEDLKTIGLGRWKQPV